MASSKADADPAGQPATWTLHASTNCYAGFGAEDLETPDGSPCCTFASIDDCFAQCAATAGCEAVVVTSTSPLLCYRRGYVELSSCVADYVGYDTYIMPSVPPPDGGGGGDGVQLKAMSFNVRFAEQSPNWRLPSLSSGPTWLRSKSASPPSAASS